MRIAVYRLLFAVFLIVVAVGCGRNGSGDEKAAAAYVQARGYKIVASKGLMDSYVLDRSKLVIASGSAPYWQAWSVQSGGPDS